MFKKSKYRNRRSVSYLSWKANNDQLRELTKLLREKSSALRDFTEHMLVIDEPDMYIHPEVFNYGYKAPAYQSFEVKLQQYSKLQRDYLSTLLKEAGETYSQFYEFKNPPRITDLVESSGPFQAAPVWKAFDQHIYQNIHVTLPVRDRSVELDLESQQFRYQIILKGILEREKNALDKQLSGNRCSVFISTTRDLRDRIRIFLRSLHIPTHDGKDEESDHIELNIWCNIFFNINNFHNGKKYKYHRVNRV